MAEEESRVSGEEEKPDDGRFGFDVEGRSGVESEIGYPLSRSSASDIPEAALIVRQKVEK